MLRHLELIDDEAAEYEVKMVKIDDPLMAKKYGHREPPGLGFFRKGNYVKYEGTTHSKTNHNLISLANVLVAIYAIFQN